MVDALARPALTLPAAEAEALTEAYRTAGTILEYGTGGSTLIAAERPSGTIFAVESDPDWLAQMRAWFDAHPPRARVHLHHADIGATRAWGFPRGHGAVARWPDYALSVWRRPDFIAPDLVLVDGRFRLACMITTLASITRETVLLVDDYAGRPAYHPFETLAGRPTMIGRMAFFHLAPGLSVPHGADWVVAAYTDPR